MRIFGTKNSNSLLKRKEKDHVKIGIYFADTKINFAQFHSNFRETPSNQK